MSDPIQSLGAPAPANQAIPAGPAATITEDKDDTPCLKPFWQKKYKSSAGKYWNDFYRRNTTKFFKDRHWLDREFPGLLTRPNTVGLEIGCGVGNLVFPALERNTSLRLFCCDFSETAISHVKSNDSYPTLASSNRCHAFVADVTHNTPFPKDVQQLDFITCVFVLSAVPPEGHVKVLTNLRDVLALNSVICFRDYAAGDLAQIRFQRAKEVPKLQHQLFVRQDGTMSYFFSLDYFTKVVESVPGLAIVSAEVIQRRTTNVKQNLDEARLFVQSVIKRVDY